MVSHQQRNDGKRCAQLRDAKEEQSGEQGWKGRCGWWKDRQEGISRMHGP